MKLPPLYHQALAYFDDVDPTMAMLLRYGASTTPALHFPTPQPVTNYFSQLVDAIVGQQISTAAAAAIRGRIHTLLPIPTPETLLAIDHEALRACGLSERKVSFIVHNASVWHTLESEAFAELPDEEVIAKLVTLHGIGPWTAEMFCIFTLARSDVFSMGDLGLRQALMQYYKLRPAYTRKIMATVERFRPYRSVAALALWHARDTSFGA